MLCRWFHLNRTSQLRWLVRAELQEGAPGVAGNERRERLWGTKVRRLLRPVAEHDPAPLDSGRLDRVDPDDLPGAVHCRHQHAPVKAGTARAEALRVAPVVALAQPASQGGPRQISPLQLLAQPLHRLRLQYAQPDPHYPRSTRLPRPVSSVI